MIPITRATAILVAGATAILAPAAGAQSSATEPTQEVVVIGASYAHGWGTPQLPGFTIKNVGVGGEETSEVLARFDADVIAARPHAVIIWGHINDIFRAPGGDMQVAARSAIANLRQMIERARAADIEPILVTEVTLSRTPGLRAWAASIVGRLLGKKSYQERVNAHVREVNDFLRTLGGQLDLLVLDFERAVDDGSGYRRVEYSEPDGSHISEVGYEQLTAYTRSVIGERNAGSEWSR